MSIETNCFRIYGLDELNTKYRLYQIVGLHRGSPEYYSNVNKIARDLSFQMKAPVTTHRIEDEHYLLVPKAFGDPPDRVMLVGCVAMLKGTGMEIDLRFTSDHPELHSVRIRYLQFIVQNPLWQDARLWLPSAGKPFFFKNLNTDLARLTFMRDFPCAWCNILKVGLDLSSI